MKRLALSIVFFSSALFAVDLTFATNQQILEELARRLNSGPGPGGNAFASYICDSYGYMAISLVAPTKTSEIKLYIGNDSQCNQQAAILSTNKSKIYSFAQAAVCDSYSYMKRYSLTQYGELKEISSTYMGDYQKCFDQAKIINQNRRP